MATDAEANGARFQTGAAGKRAKAAPDGILSPMLEEGPIGPETPITARIRWGPATASIPIHIAWPFLKDGALMFAEKETDPRGS